MFEPLGEILDMMRHYGVVIPEETLVQFQELPEKWANTKRLTLIAMQQVAPLQALEVIKLKKKTQNFERTQNEFRRAEYMKEPELDATSCVVLQSLASQSS